MSMLSYERKVRVRGGPCRRRPVRLLASPFYVGFFGVTAIFFTLSGRADRLLAPAQQGTFNIWLINIPPPDLSYGLASHRSRKAGCGRPSPSAPSAHSFLGAAQAEISRKLGMGYHIPLPTASHLRLRHARGDPARADGRLGHGFPYGIWSHLDWVSNVGYQYLHFHYNPAHMIAITFFFTTTWRSRCTARWCCRR
jgi:photosynthetic reaction center L subunit